MQFILNKAFPHPVLASHSQDYTDVGFQAAFWWSEERENRKWILQVRCELGDQSMERLIESGKAKYAVEVVCPQTFLRRTAKPRGRKSSFEIPFGYGDLHGWVYLNAFVICCEPIQNFRSHHFHQEFGANAFFDLEPGDVLALQAPLQYSWDTEQIRPIGTVFELVKSDKPKNGTFLVSWESEKIQIQMRENDKQRFEVARRTREKKPSLIMSVYFPTLLETLRTMSEGSEYEEKKWYQTIQYKLNEKDIELSRDSDFLKIGQKLLGFPLGKFLPEFGE